MAGITKVIRNLFSRVRRDAELDAELQSFVDLSADEKAAAGAPPEAARRQALIEMGGVEQLKEQVRERRAGARIEQLFQDLRFGLRMLRKAPGFTAVAVLTLALGIGANTAIFSVIYGVLLQPLPYPEADRVAKVFMHFSPQNNPRGHMCLMDFLDWRAQNHALEEPAAYSNDLFNLLGVGPPEQLRGARVTAGFFPAMRVAPIMGRTFQDDEDSAAAANLVVISEGLWRRKFNGSESAIGRAISLNGQSATIIGVMPAFFRFPNENTELWANLHLGPPRGRFPFLYTGIGRLKPGVTWEQAQADTNAIGHAIEAAGKGEYRNLSMPVVPIREVLVGDVRLPLLIMFAAVIAVLLIASVNVANLLLARSTTRRREMAVRVSIGARRGRLLRQLITESLSLSFVGAGAGVALAWYAIRLLRVWNPGNLPRIETISLNAPVLGFTVMVAVVTGVLFGVGPALESAGTEPVCALKEDARAGGGRGQRMRAALVVAEIALSFVLLIAGGLLLRSFDRLQRVDTGIEAPPDRVLTMLVSPSPARYKEPKQQVAILDRVLQQVRQVPGIDAAAWSDSRPPNYWANDDTFNIRGRPYDHEAFPSSPIPTVSPDYFRAIGVRLLRGRYFEPDDVEGRPYVAVISQELARRYFAGEDPIGQEIAPSEPNPRQPWYRIIGVVSDVKYGGLASEASPVWYTAIAQGPGLPMFLIVRTSRSADAVGTEVERAIRSVDPEIVITGRATLEAVISNSVAQPRFRTALLALFAGIALILAAIGTYGVLGYSVTQRTREIGIRVALGAPPARVLRMVISHGARLGLAGVVIGVIVALAGTRALRAILFQTSATDVLTFAGVTALLLAVSVWASFVPARRAMKVNPVEALRSE